MRLLVTGAGGQVGEEFLQEAGAHPIFVEVMGTKREQLDFTDRSQVFDAVTGFGPDWIVHLGAMTAVDACEDDPDAAYLANALSVRYLKQAARRTGSRICYLSTDYVFDGKASTPYREWDPTSPLSVYGKSKLAGEAELEADDLIVRTSWVMGRYGRNILKTILSLARAEGTVRFVADQVGSPTVVEDLARTISTLLLEDMSGIFHVTNQGHLSWYDLVRFVFAEVGADQARVVPIDSAEIAATRKAPRPAFSVLDNCALRVAGMAPMPHYRESVAKLARRLWDAG